jgi:hopanoid biosynthesis associated RND transporter like protein HpnN
MAAERTPHADDSLLAAPLLAVTEWGISAPATVLVGACALAIVAIAITVNGLTFKTSRLDLLNPRSEYNQRWLAYLAEFGERDDACLVVRAERKTDLTAALDDLAGQLRQEPKLFDSVFYRRDLSRLKSKALHYIPVDQLAPIEQQLAKAAAALPRAGEPLEPATQLARLNDEMTYVSAASPQQRKRIEERYAQAAGLLLAGLNPSAGAAAQSPEVSPLPPDALALFEPQYLLADDDKLGFVLTRLDAQPAESAANSTAIARLREIVRQIQFQHPRVWIGLTGMPVIEYDEMAASQFDMLWTSVASMVVVLLLYLAAYGGLRHAMLVNGLLLLGTAYSFGFVTITVGHLNILSAAFSAVLIGLGIDFAIHYVASYLNLRRHGCDEETALLRMAVEVGPGVVTGGVTTAAAFFMAAMTDFIGIRELGLVAGGGILLCVLSTVVVLPPLILLVDRRWPLVKLPGILPASRWFQFPIHSPRLTMAVALGIAVVVTAGSVNLRYDHNLLNLQPRHVESADIERQLFTRLDDSVWFAVSVCTSRDEVQARKAAFAQLPLVAKTEEIAALLPDPSPAHTARLAALCRQLATLPAHSPRAAAIDPARLQQEITRAQELLARETPYETPATVQLAQFKSALAAIPADQVAARLAQGQAALVSAIGGQLAPLRAIADPQPPRLEDLPPELTDRFVGKNRTYLLKVFARGNIWNMEQLEKFVHAVESVDPRVTGHPVQTYYASRHMQSSYLWAGVYALGAVLVLLWIDFRSLAHSLLAMVPLAIGFATMCGCLGWLDIPFNAANMIVLPLILGIGVDHGVHLVHLWRQQRGRFALGDATTVAVLLTAATTTASFGALILARHQGLQSLGQTLTLGVTTCLAASIAFFPALLAWLTRNRPSAEEAATVEQIATAPAVESRPTEEPIESPAAVEPVVSAPVMPEVPIPPPPDLPQSIQPSTVIDAPVPILVELAIETLPLAPAPVTDEEIAALLESALTTFPGQASSANFAPSKADDEPASTIPRRRNLPRRSEAA